jgi:polysaccharide export outer membrane protein
MKAGRAFQVVAVVAALTGTGIGTAAAAGTAASSTQSPSCVAQDVARKSDIEKNGYRIQPGDHLEVFVRQDPSLQRQVLVLPDGTISLPLLGIVAVLDKSVEDVESTICQSLVARNLIEDPNVTVSVQQLGANLFYVIGKVARPGSFELTHNLDVIKGLAVAGGLATFAKEGEIRILRRVGNSSKEYRFDYGKFMNGHDRETNILLRPGDVIVVP